MNPSLFGVEGAPGACTDLVARISALLQANSARLSPAAPMRHGASAARTRTCYSYKTSRCNLSLAVAFGVAM
jgi:hypothetical protein